GGDQRTASGGLEAVDVWRQGSAQEKPLCESDAAALAAGNGDPAKEFRALRRDAESGGTRGRVRRRGRGLQEGVARAEGADLGAPLVPGAAEKGNARGAGPHRNAAAADLGRERPVRRDGASAREHLALRARGNAFLRRGLALGASRGGAADQRHADYIFAIGS